jgi:hypothetical protein
MDMIHVLRNSASRSHRWSVHIQDARYIDAGESRDYISMGISMPSVGRGQRR